MQRTSPNHALQRTRATVTATATHHLRPLPPFRSARARGACR
jgi:hypothetical protein